MSDCIRRPNSVWSSCPCEPCRIDSRRKSKLQRNGHYRRIPSADAWEVIDRKRAAGWSSLAIASAAGTIHGTIQNALSELERTGHRTHFGPTVSRRLINIGDPTKGSVGVTGSTRRLRGLARQGYDLEALAAITGIGFSTLAAIRSGSTTRVRASFYTTIRDHTNRIGITPGPSLLAPKRAENKGWESLATWLDIDDPNERPRRTTDHRPKTDVDPVVVLRVIAGDRLPMTTAERRAVVAKARALGWSEETIRERTGISRATDSARYGEREAS